MGEIVGRDDMDNILLVNTKTIRSIPKLSVGEIASRNVISFKMDCNIRDAAKKLIANEIDGAPVMKDGKVVGVFTVTDLVKAVAQDNDDKTVGDVMSTNVVIVNENLRIANAIEVMLKKSISRLIIADNDNNLLGIVTRTDLIDCITSLDQFPIKTN